MKRPRRVRKRKESKHLTISARNAEWEEARAKADRRGLTIARYVKTLMDRDVSDGEKTFTALTPEEQRELLEGVRELRALLREEAAAPARDEETVREAPAAPAQDEETAREPPAAPAREEQTGREPLTAPARDEETACEPPAAPARDEETACERPDEETGRASGPAHAGGPGQAESSDSAESCDPAEPDEPEPGQGRLPF